MANDYRIPYQDLINLVPKNLRNPMAKSLIDNLFNRFMTKDESVPLYGFVGRRPASIDDRTPKVPQSSVERDINALIPITSFKVGTETYSFTPQDLIRKADVLGAPDDQSEWLYSQGNNFAPPIDFDRFTNFFSYYWIAAALPTPPTLPWNPTLEPEYYSIAAPALDALDKLNVKTVSSGFVALTGTGFYAQSYEVEFLTSTSFVVRSVGGTAADKVYDGTTNPALPFLPGVGTPGPYPADEFAVAFTDGTPAKTLLSFIIKREALFDEFGDFMGYEGFLAGDTFSISAPFISSNYNISFDGAPGLKGKIVAVDSLDEYQTISGVQVSQGDRVLIKDNSAADNGIYIVRPGAWERAPDFSGSTLVAGARVFVTQGTFANNLYTSFISGAGTGFNLTSTNAISNTNNWQETNYWIPRSELLNLGLDQSKVVQATRPIIEYRPTLQLNSYFNSTGPSDSGTLYRQEKHQFNQVPLFDLFRYDGTHSGLVSPVFFYVEDQTAAIDPQLQRRVKKANNQSGDFVFAHGAVTGDTLLFFKDAGSLKTVWHPGYTAATVVNQIFSGDGDGTLTVSVGTSDPYTAQQVWTLTATSATTFEVAGSKNRVLPAPLNVLTAGVPYDNGLFTALVTVGSTAFEAGDVFTFNIGNFETTRYVYRDADEQLYDLHGSAAGDLAGQGAWQVPRMFFSNLQAQSSGEIPEGTLYSHLRSVLINQLPGTEQNNAFGGSVKLWSEQVNLLASLMMQRDLTPISIIDLAQRQYETATNSLMTLFIEHAKAYTDSTGAITTQAALDTFVDYLLELRKNDYSVRTVLYDSTSPVIGFPPTLPLLGVSPLSVPGWYFDNELGVTLIKRHDGSLIPPVSNTIQFRDQFGPPGTTLQQDMAALLNDVLLTIELRLYDGISDEQRTYFHEADIAAALTSDLAPYLERELAAWAAVNGYDATAPDFEPSNAFTWNYSSSAVSTMPPAFSAATVPARWFNVLQSHQAAVPGVIPTLRPDLEPWKLLGFAADPGIAWHMYRAVITPADLEQGGYLTGSARVVVKSAATVMTPLSGLSVIDGKAVQAGDVVLLVSEANAANNGLWIASSGVWTRATTPLLANTVIDVREGTTYAGSKFVLTTTVVSVNVSPALFEQVRLWTDAMWADIKAQRPTLKLSVNTGTDALLPPYVNAAVPAAAEALSTFMPPQPELPYSFGQGSIVETTWTRSTEFRYSLARAVCRKDPLAWLGHMWGFEWVEVDGILYDGYDVSIPGPARFRLHGEAASAVTRAAPLSVSLATGPADFSISITRDAYTAAREQSWTVRLADGTFLGRVNEGVLYPALTSNGYTLTNLLIEDRGQPFRIGDRFVLASNASGSGLTYTFEAAPYTVFNGFGQSFTHALREGNIDTTQGYAVKAYREWTMNLGYRAGGLVSTEDLRVFNDAETIPESAYELRFKNSGFAKNLWLQALRVTVVQFGSRVPGPNGGFVASTDASDWTFRIQGYNSRYPTFEYYTLNTAGPFVTFNALQGESTIREWRQYTETTGLVEAQLPLVVVGLQNVLNIMFGYQAKLMDDGWRFEDPEASNVDAETGRIKNWQLEIEKLIDRMYRGIDLGQGHVVNPFMDRVWVEQPTGLLSKFYDTSLFDVTGHPAVFDTLGEKISAEDLVVLRTRDRSQIGAAAPMFSVHAQLDEFEHLFVFSNLTSPSTESGLVYDPFSGARIATIKFNGRRQGNNTLRPEFGGHYLVGDEVRKNLQASTDTVAKYYDADSVFQDEKSTKHALALLGFTPKSYMTDLDLNDRSQFNFWRGLVQMKGTNASITAFLNNARFEDARLDEYWAYKIAEYGDSRSKIFPELRLSVQDTIQQFTKLQFDVEVGDPTFTQIQSNDEDRWFSIDDLSSAPTRFETTVLGTYEKETLVDEIIQLPFIADYLVGTGFEVINVNTIKATGAAVSITGYGASTPNFNPVKLFNYAAAELVEEIPFWHPAIGQHTPTALESINVISSRDPARYNFSTLVVGNANFDPLRSWGAKEVGRVWWDTTNLSYVPYYDSIIYSALDQRLNRWGTLADFATVDVVEWVESTVPPEEYNAQAAIDAGDADLDPLTKADGQVYGEKTYERTRTWQIRPIAWSQSSAPFESAHTGGAIGQRGQFQSDFNAKLYFKDDRVVLDDGSFAAAGIAVGMHFGAVEDTTSNFRALSEHVIQEFVMHVSTSAAADAFTGIDAATLGSLVADIKLESTAPITAVGEVVFGDSVSVDPLNDSDGLTTNLADVRSFLRIQIPGTTFDETVQIRNDRAEDVGAGYESAFDVQAGDVLTYSFAQLGLRLTVTVLQDATAIPTAALAEMLSLELNDAALSIFAAATFSDVVPLDFSAAAFVDAPYSDLGFLSNDFTDPDQLDHAAPAAGGLGWRAWNVPTQEQLDADSQFPNSEWYPVQGPFYDFSPDGVTIQAVASTGEQYALNNGTAVQRYSTTWAEWTELRINQIKTAALVTGDVVLDLGERVSSDRVSVYVNGVAQLTGTYQLIGTTLTVFGVLQGHQVVTVVRPYTPTAAELAFDPSVLDNLLVQKQFKIDYQYVEVPIRSADGSITTTRYYFWVKNRSTAARKKSQSVKAMAQLLTDGPSQYVTFQNLDAGTTPPKYNSITISGLSYVVTRDDAFKLRFTRDFTLRDDPNGLDLKDTYTEWALIRPGQRTKIPDGLWNKLVNAACGQDAGGNTLPSPQRSSYDERNGTTSRFGFSSDQILAPTDLVTGTLLYTILNTKLVDDSGPVPIPDYMDFLDFNESDSWFASPTSTRNILTKIWNEGKVSQINELFFAVLEDITASNYELTDLFKTSRLSAYSIKIVRTSPIVPTYE